jgi:hypothetical protein
LVTENETVTLNTIHRHSPSGYAQVVDEKTDAGSVVAR